MTDQDQYVIIPGFEWLEKEMERINCVDVWICWYEENNQVTEWWIQEIIFSKTINITLGFYLFFFPLYFPINNNDV